MTTQPHNVSEVAQLRQQIALECEALSRVMYAPAIIASHAMIDRRYKQLDRCHDQLSQLIGEQEATEMTVDIYDSIVK